MKILIDNHHGALLKSFHYLFNIRFNADVYIPYGFDWLDVDKLYSNYPQRDTANQMLNSWISHNNNSSCFLKMELEKFIDSDIDVIVCSLYENYEIFKSIIKKYDKKCKLILHIGNNLQPETINNLGVKNLLSSSWPSYIHTDVSNKVFCRQEFSLEYFIPKFDCNINSVANYKHILDEEERDVFIELEKKLPHWNFKCYGANNRDGIIDQDEKIMADSIRDFGFIYHFKKIDEGFGHIIHNAFACGKPVITNSKTMSAQIHGENIGNTASLLFENDVTILDLDKNDSQSISYKLKKMADEYPIISQKIYDKFRNVVDFSEEYKQVKLFMENLI